MAKDEHRSPWETLSEDLPYKIAEYIGLSELRKVGLANKHLNRLFYPTILYEQKKRRLLHAIFMGNEEIVAQLVALDPKVLFQRGTYEMPLFNEKDPLSFESEQIYHDVTPLELLLFTGDFKMWDSVFPLILTHPQLKSSEKSTLLYQVLILIEKHKRGGPDIVKINFDPRKVSWCNLKHFYDQDTLYPLLSNPDGILFYHDGLQNRYFYAHPEKNVLEELMPSFTSEEERRAFLLLQSSIDNELVNSSRRSSDSEHRLIQKVFKKTIERNGIHYEFKGNHYEKGIHFHDTKEGSWRLINAYRRYLLLYHEHVSNPSTNIEKAWVTHVGLAQRYSMPNIIQHYLEIDKPFFPLPSLERLIERDSQRQNTFFNWISNEEESFYPLRKGSGCGIEFALEKGVTVGGFAKGIYTAGWRVGWDLAAIMQIMDVRNICIHRWQKLLTDEVEQKMIPSLYHP